MTEQVRHASMKPVRLGPPSRGLERVGLGHGLPASGFRVSLMLLAKLRLPGLHGSQLLQWTRLMPVSPLCLLPQAFYSMDLSFLPRVCGCIILGLGFGYLAFSRGCHGMNLLPMVCSCNCSVSCCLVDAWWLLGSGHSGGGGAPRWQGSSYHCVVC